MEDNQGIISVTMSDISLTAENYTPTATLNLPHGDYVIIEVKDNGKGMATDLRDKILIPISPPNREGTAGALDFPWCTALSPGARGLLSWTASRGKAHGSPYIFPVFPMNQKTKKLRKTPSPPEKAKSFLWMMKKMLVDLGKMMLERIGYEAVSLQSPSEALSIFQKDPDSFSLVITDLTMPNLQGTQLASEIKKISPQTPVILATGFDSHTAMSRGDSKDIDMVMSKTPFH